MFFFLSLFWFIRESRAFLFWLYLWQLKEYHLGRFLDHFRTERGKRLLFNPFLILKIILLFYAFFLAFYVRLLPRQLYTIWQLYAIWIFILIIFYIFESFKLFQDLFQKTLKKPVLTQKTLTLIVLIFIAEISFLYILFQKFYFALFPNFYWFAFYLLIFDVLTPFIVTIIVFLIHSFTVIFFRNRIIEKAKRKRAEFSAIGGSAPGGKNLLVIGITGSYGKTSTKEILFEILSQKFKVLKTKEHQNSEVGISQCILNELTEGHQVFVCEMGAYNKGGIKLLCDIAKPKMGILTGINEQHMATFGSLENIIRTKYELIESLPEDGLAFFNAKNKYCLELYQKTKIKKYLYGQEAKFFGEENLLGAIAIAKELGMTEKEIEPVYQKIKNKIPGIEFKKGINGLIIDATYSANPAGVIAHLEHLKTLRQAQGKLIIIMPCLIELGKASKEIHKRIGEKIGEVCDLAIITTKERFKEIKEGAVKRGIRKEDILFLENPNTILEKIKPYLIPDNIILLEGRVSKKIFDILLEKIL